MILPEGTAWRRLARTGLPLLLALLVIAGFIFHARLLAAQTPTVKNGVLDLGKWNGKKTIGITGEWEFYWNRLLTQQEIRGESQAPVLVSAPDKWNYYKINGSSLPGKGKATYRVRVTGAEEGKRYGVRIQSMASAYRLYMDDLLIAQNGSIGDTGSASASGYRPQLAAFIPTKDSFDLVLQISNDAYGIGGMWEPVIFGAYEQVLSFDRLISTAGTSATSGIIVACLFFLIFFAIQRGEKDMLILSGISMVIQLKYLTIGDVMLTAFFPDLTIGSLLRIDYLATVWTQFLLLYFIYYAYANLVPDWQVMILIAYNIIATLFIILFPLDIVTLSYIIINSILLIVLAVITLHLSRAASQGREGATLLLGAQWLIFLLVFYDIFLPDRSTGYYLMTNLHFDYMLFAFAQVAVLALRYRRAQGLEIAHLKGQIRPHFIHNALTSIISISRTEPDRARELLMDFSSYLRGFYDYERDELISFSQELELVQAYAALEQARFGEQLRLECRIETEDFLLPSLVLQPLVENAFVHGLREKDDGGTVMVYSRRVKNGRVRVGVWDDGVGLSIKAAPVRRGVGIENTNRRLYKLYRTSLVYLAPEDGGCEVYFEIPYKEVEKHEGMAY